MQAQLNKQQQKDHLSQAQKKLQVCGRRGQRRGAGRDAPRPPGDSAAQLAGWWAGVVWSRWLQLHLHTGLATAGSRGAGLHAAGGVG
jgi:hypothetical protein